MTVGIRQAIERAIVEATVKTLLRAGYSLSVNDGEKITLKHSRVSGRVLKALFTTDDDVLIVHEVGKNTELGWVRFIYGNSGYDVINDYTVNLSKVLKPVDELANRIEEGKFKVVVYV